MTKHNFGPAAPDEKIVYGAYRPGRFSRAETLDAVKDWISHVQSRGIERVYCLLDDEHLTQYDDLLGRYRQSFGADHVCHAPISDFSVVDREVFHGQILPFLKAAAERAERTVVHCSAGQGRTGHVLVLWLVHGRGYDLETVVETVQATGRAPLEAASVTDLDEI